MDCVLAEARRSSFFSFSTEGGEELKFPKQERNNKMGIQSNGQKGLKQHFKNVFFTGRIKTHAFGGSGSYKLEGASEGHVLVTVGFFSCGTS